MEIIIGFFLICFSLVALVFIKAVAKQEIADLAQWITNARDWMRKRRAAREQPVVEHRNARPITFGADGKKVYQDEEFSHRSL